MRECSTIWGVEVFDITDPIFRGFVVFMMVMVFCAMVFILALGVVFFHKEFDKKEKSERREK